MTIPSTFTTLRRYLRTLHREHAVLRLTLLFVLTNLGKLDLEEIRTALQEALEMTEPVK